MFLLIILTVCIKKKRKIKNKMFGIDLIVMLLLSNWTRAFYYRYDSDVCVRKTVSSSNSCG